MHVNTTPHVGNHCPCHPDTLVQVDLGDGQRHVGAAGSWAWGPGLGDQGEGRIIGWAAVGHTVNLTKGGAPT